MSSNKQIEIQVFGDVSLNGLFCDPQYLPDLKDSLKTLDHEEGRGDLRIINWEAPITNDFQFNERKNPAIATTRFSADVFTAAFPVDVACLGNNHIGDCLDEGFITTYSYFKANGISTVGAASTAENASSAILKNINGNRIKILSFVGDETNAKISPDSSIFINTINDPDMYDIIKSNSIDVDYLLVNLHWGIEFVQYPSLSQRIIAKKCIDAGANVIIGHHSHCMQGVERYNGGVIMYSLGNFVFSGLKGKEIFGWPGFCNRGGFYKLFLSKNEDISFQFIPFTVSNRGVCTDELDANRSCRIQDNISSRFNYSDRRYGWIYRFNIFRNWFVRLPLFLIQTKGGLLGAFKSYFKIHYLKLFISYFLPNKWN